SILTGSAVDPSLLGVLNGFCLDRVLRMKMSQAHVNWFYAEELPVPCVRSAILPALTSLAMSLGCAHPVFAPQWLLLRPRLQNLATRGALTGHERLRLR